MKEISANVTASTHVIITQAFGLLSDRADKLEERFTRDDVAMIFPTCNSANSSERAYSHDEHR